MSATAVGSADMPQETITALPYVDKDFNDPAMGAQVLAMIEEEKMRYRPNLQQYLSYLPPVPESRVQKESVFMQAELERVTMQQPIEQLDQSRYSLPAPSKANRNSLEAWQYSVQNAKAQLEHQNNRILNLELMTKYGTQAWRMHTEELIQTEAAYQHLLRGIRDDIQSLNWDRKQEQESAGSTIQALETKWGELVSKNYELRCAISAMENEIGALESK